MGESDTTMIGQFSIKVRIGNAEIEVSAPDKDFVLDESDRLIEQFKLTPTTSHPASQTMSLNNETSSVASETKLTKPQTFAEFFKQFTGLQTNLDKMLVIGYWFERKQNQPHFTIEDIQAKYKNEIKEAAPANIKRDLEKLRSKGLLMPPEKSDNGTLAYSLSNSGIKEVESKMSQE